jgi:Domain of unknown function (DUF4082)
VPVTVTFRAGAGSTGMAFKAVPGNATVTFKANPATPYRFFSSFPTAAITGPNNFSLGIRLKALKAGNLTKILFDRDASDTVTRTLRLYRYDGNGLVNVTVPASSTPGEQIILLPSPISLILNQEFTIALNANDRWRQGPDLAAYTGSAGLALIGGYADYGNPFADPSLNSANNTAWGLDCILEA